MSDPAPSSDLAIRLARVQALIEDATSLWDQGRTASAVILAARGSHLLGRLVEALKSKNEESAVYINMLVRNKLESMAADETYFRSQEEKMMESPEPPALDDWDSALKRLSRHADIVATEVRERFSDRARWFDWSNRTVRRVTLVAAVLGALVICGWLFRLLHYNGHGLKGQFFQGNDFTALLAEAPSKSIDVNFRRNPPVKNLPETDFCARWTGSLVIPEDDNYIFYLTSDDGVRLWVGDVLVIDNWTVHAEQTNQGAVQLPKGAHPLRMEYFQASGDAVLRLHWKKRDWMLRRLLVAPYLGPTGQ